MPDWYYRWSVDCLTFWHDHPNAWWVMCGIVIIVVILNNRHAKS